ncbi:MAG: hypothetical protein ACK56I_27015, partial [bacterium]
MAEGCREERGRVGRPHRRREPGVVLQPLEEADRQAIHAQRVLEPGVRGARVDEGHEPQLTDPREPPHFRGVEQRSDPRCERHRHVGRLSLIHISEPTR